MEEHIYSTSCGDIHYWINKETEEKSVELIFLPGLTAEVFTVVSGETEGICFR